MSIEWLRRIESGRGSAVVHERHVPILAEALSVTRDWLMGVSDEGGPVNRRDFLRAAGTIAAAGALAPVQHLLPAVQAAGSKVVQFRDINPIEHLARVRAVLVDADNLLGPHHAIPQVVQHIELIQHLRASRSGADNVELLRMRGRFAEFASWLYQDAGDTEAAKRWLDRALEWAHAVGDTEMATYVLARKSQLAGELGDAMTAIDCAAAARHLAQARSTLHALALTYGAQGEALAGRNTECLRTLNDAQELLATMDRDPNGRWAPWLDTGYVDVHRAQCFTWLGVPKRGIGLFQDAIRDLPPTFRRDRGVYLAREALAHAGSREPEQAAQVGAQALAIAVETQSGRIANELSRLAAALNDWRAVPMVREFHSQIAEVAS
jgi:tetratricopeptide (TPR) repeat protein